MRRSDGIFIVLLCLAIVYYAAAREGDRTVFSSCPGGIVYMGEGEEEEESRTGIILKSEGKRYSAELEQNGEGYIVTAADTKETCWEADKEYGIFEVVVQDEGKNTVQEFSCRIPVMHVVSLTFDDLDLDGFLDLKIGYSNWKNDTNYCKLYLWDKEAGRFCGNDICIPMEYEIDEERGMFQTFSHDADGEKRVIYKINENKELEELRYWEIDYATHKQIIGESEGDKVIYEGLWGKYVKKPLEREEDCEDVFWSGLLDSEENLRTYWEYQIGEGEAFLQDLIPGKSLKLVFRRDGEEKIVRVLQKYAEYNNPREYIADGWEDSSGCNGIYLWNQLYPKWRNVEYYVEEGKELVRLDECRENGKNADNEIESALGGNKETADLDKQTRFEKRLEFAEKLQQPEQEISMERTDYLAATEASSEEEIERELYDEAQRLLDRCYTEWDITVHRAVKGDLNSDGTDDIIIGKRENKEYQLYTCLNGTDDPVWLDSPVSLGIMDVECLYRSQIAILENKVVITGWGGEAYWGTQTLVFEYDDYEIERKFLMESDGEWGSSEVRWEICDYEKEEKKFFWAEDAEAETVRLWPLEVYLERKGEMEEPLEHSGTFDERKVYEEFLRGGQTLYVRKEALANGSCLNAGRFSVWEEYTLEDILSFMRMDYWLDGGEADGKVREIQYAYLDCGGDGFLELAVRFVGMGTYGIGDGDDSNITLIISCKNKRLELCYAFEEWARSMTDIYYYGFMDSAGSSGAWNHGFSHLFLDSDCMEKIIYVMDEGWGGGLASRSYEDYERVFTVETEIREPAMYIQCYHIENKRYQCYYIEETEEEKIGRCEEFIEALRQKGEVFYTPAELDAVIRKQRKRLGIKEEWMEQRKLEWKKMDSGQYSAYVKGRADEP